MEIGKEGIGPLESIEIDIDALSRAIIDCGFYKNVLEMIDLPQRYEEPPIFEPKFEKDEILRMMNSSPVISELLDKVYVRESEKRGEENGNQKRAR